MNEPLIQLYYLKDEFSKLWNQDSADQSEWRFRDWLRYAERLNISAITTFYKTIRNDAPCFLGYYDYSISSGPLEALNNKIKL